MGRLMLAWCDLTRA